MWGGREGEGRDEGEVLNGSEFKLVSVSGGAVGCTRGGGGDCSPAAPPTENRQRSVTEVLACTCISWLTCHLPDYRHTPDLSLA